ncbi:uncharacterized protein LOC134847908 [Symsagittifera roscoffensis]|uniref:uncharacterized protein LOC134847908 n=1 Tax=Symsagittifera roscoffensis TaxID=84072 RepID=UPI00307B51DB
MSGEELDAEKIEELKEVFNSHDPEGQGMVKSGELGEMFQQLGLELFPEEVEDITVEIDKNSDGVFDFAEFEALYSKLTKPMTEDDVMQAFKFFDKEKLGFIWAEDLKNILMTIGDKMTEKEADELIKTADMNYDGKIQYINFVGLMASELGTT